MSVQYNTSPTVTNGLFLCLDAASKKSYPGTGTTWFDASAYSTNLTLAGSGYTYSSNGFFTNSADGALGTISNLTTASNNFSYDVWAKPTATHEIDAQSSGGTNGISGQKYLIGANQAGAVNGGAGISCGTNGISVYEHGDGYMPPLLVWSGSVSSTVMSHIVVVYTSKQPQLYVNGVLVATGLTSTKTAVVVSNTVGFGPYGFFTGDIAAVRFYDRSLSQSEITQNFNALKGRYGL
jgi:hypothetical protein